MKTHLQSFADAAEGLAFEDGLFKSDGPQAGVWSTKEPSLVCPRAYKKQDGFDTACEESGTAGWPVYLRPTGGGTVPQGLGIDNLVLAFDAWPGSTIESCYRLLTRILRLGLAAASLNTGDTPGSFCDGAWNLSSGPQKLIGTAQRWRPRRGGPARVLAHALILTRDTFHPGARAVAAFHAKLGMKPIALEAHTSLETALGTATLPAASLFRAAEQELAMKYADQA